MSQKKSWVEIASNPGAMPDGLLAGTPTGCQMSHSHWHAQVEINYVFHGTLHYQMVGYDLDLQPGDFCVFWGGTPHRAVNTPPDTQFVVIHLPLVHFFRLHLSAQIATHLTHGGAVVAAGRAPSDDAVFERIVAYMQSAEAVRREHGIDELLVRMNRLNFEPFRFVGLVPNIGAETRAEAHPFHNVVSLCTYITDNFRNAITSVDIASSVDVHPKYAMSMFKKSTGMTLNSYVTLLRVSYAQALLLNESVTIATVAFESGFGTIGAFNQAFRRSTSQTPSDFRRQALSKGKISLGGLHPAEG